MNDYMLIISRTVFVYIIVLLVFRLMGKREVGELSILDLAVFVLMAEVAAFALDDVHKNFWKDILPILILFGIQYINSVLLLRIKKLRDIIDGDPSMIVENGLILEHEMRKQRYNLDDLFQQLREQGVSSVQSVACAFLEQSGKLSVYLKDDSPYVLPLILDGYVDARHLKLLRRDQEWLEQELHAIGYYDVAQIFYCSYENGQLHVQLKARKN
ncbi:DUF421 domain-containing protein [Solibacillus sp. FSL H8-0538]|uniref:DUF421 domain-containing protein n=1 Tax=Solibacillus sp. FSL H8-0538 TaxID=2921400 RepID=UPI0030FBDB8A